VVRELNGAIEMPLYPYDTRAEEAKIMRALVAAGDAGLSRSQLWKIATPYWKLERALTRLRMFEKARRQERVKTGRRGRRREMWFALVADDTMVHGLDPEWSIVVDGA